MRDIYLEHPDVVCVSCYIWNLSFVKELMADKMDDAVIVETNTYYEGDRYTTTFGPAVRKFLMMRRNS